jgi:hypothetical protein
MLNLKHSWAWLPLQHAEHQQSGKRGERIQRWWYRSTNTSIWFMSWGENTAHMIYPEGMVAGFQHEDLGDDLE